VAKALALQPPLRGPRVAVVTSSGSLGALAIDACLDAGLTAAQLSPATVESVRAAAPAWMNVKNPLDVGPSGQFAVALAAVLADPQVDGVIAIPVIPYSVVRAFGPFGFTAAAASGDLGKIWQESERRSRWWWRWSGIRIG